MSSFFFVATSFCSLHQFGIAKTALVIQSTAPNYSHVFENLWKNKKRFNILEMSS